MAVDMGAVDMATVEAIVEAIVAAVVDMEAEKAVEVVTTAGTLVPICGRSTGARSA
jgi:hypothetical protein